MKSPLIKRANRFQEWWGKPLRQGVPLKQYSSFHIGGKADLFVTTRCEEELVRAIQGAVTFELPYAVIGMGTNILISDEGFRGLIIRNFSRRVPEVDGAAIWAPSSCTLASVVEAAREHNLTGMEFATGIPGTVGAAIYINAGAFGSSISDRIVWGRVISKKGKIRIIRNDEYAFDYRSSRLKKTREIALGALFQCEPGVREEIESRMEEILALRAQKHPGRGSYNAGSYFKNLQPNEPGGRRQAAGKFLEMAGAKGMRYGGASVFSGHANFIINEGRAKAKDVLELAGQLKALVAGKFGIQLVEEVRFLDAIKGFKRGD